MNISNYYFAGVIDTVKRRDNFKNDIWENLAYMILKITLIAVFF